MEANRSVDARVVDAILAAAEHQGWPALLICEDASRIVGMVQFQPLVVVGGESGWRTFTQMMDEPQSLDAIFRLLLDATGQDTKVGVVVD